MVGSNPRPGYSYWIGSTPDNTSGTWTHKWSVPYTATYAETYPYEEPNYIDRCIASEFRSPKSPEEISANFWKNLHKMLPKPVQNKIVDFRDFKPRFNVRARPLRMLFPKGGKIPKRTRERKKCRSSR